MEGGPCSSRVVLAGSTGGEGDYLCSLRSRACGQVRGGEGTEFAQRGEPLQLQGCSPAGSILFKGWPGGACT